MDKEINNVMKYFPDIKLSYEEKVYKKVYCKFDYYTAIPYANKYFAWFKTFNNRNTLYIMELNTRKKSILNIVKYHSCFSDKLCSKTGTLLYGSIVTNKNLKYFCIEDIFFFSGKDLANYNKREKIKLLEKMLKNDMKQQFFSKSSIVFCLPIMTNNISDISKLIYNSPYKIWSIKYNCFNNNKVFFEKVSIFNIFANFIVKATISPDIYNLYVLTNNKLAFYKNTVVRNYKNSILMNNLFRNIKENNNLDLLEESDDEEEFENISASKFVNLETKLLMKCKYNSKFKIWEPMEIVEGKISKLDDIKVIEKNL